MISLRNKEACGGIRAQKKKTASKKMKRNLIFRTLWIFCLGTFVGIISSFIERCNVMHADLWWFRNKCGSRESGRLNALMQIKIQQKQDRKENQSPLTITVQCNKQLQWTV